ncbi:MAG: tetratricopeptide repeat protein [Candidatus Obscuribacter sp.]|nr:tetratricopeptide repeat protein [Candidatus Obscuribacter sp.]
MQRRKDKKVPLLASAICAIGLTFTTSIQAAESETLSVSSDRVDAILVLIGTKKYKEASALADSCIASGKTSGSKITPGDWRQDELGRPLVFALLPQSDLRHLYLAEMFNLKGMAQFSLGQNKEAIESFKLASRENPFCSQAYSNMGAAQSELGQAQEAVATLNKALRLNPRYPEAYRNRAEAYRRLKQFALSQKDMEQYRYWTEQNKKDELDLVIISKFDYALKVISKLPGNADSLTALATIHWEKGNLKESERAFQSAITHNTSSAKAHGAYGIFLLSLNKYDSAIKELSIAISKDPSYLAAIFARGRANLVSGHPKEAINDFDSLLSYKTIDDARLRSCWGAKGDAFLALKQYQKALHSYRQALSAGAAGTERAFYLTRCGLAQQEMGKAGEATKNFDQALSADQNYKPALNGRAKSMLSAGQYEQAIADFDTSSRPATTAGKIPDAKELTRLISYYSKLTVINPREIENYYNRGILYLASGDAKSAAADFQKVLSFKNEATATTDYAFCFATIAYRLDKNEAAAQKLKQTYKALPRKTKPTPEVEHFLSNSKVMVPTFNNANYSQAYKTRVMTLIGLSAYCRGDKKKASECLAAVSYDGNPSMDEYVLAEIFLKKLK